MVRPRGVVLIIGAIVLFMLAGITRVGWILLFDTVLWGIIMLSAVMPWLAIGDLQVRRRVAGWVSHGGIPGPMEGDPIEFEVRLHNRGILPCMLVAIYYNWGDIESDKKRLFLAWLGRRRSLVASARVKFGRRGLHTLPPAKVETSLPFGLFRRSKRAEDVSQLLILPRVYPIGRLAMLGEAGNDAPRPLQARIGEQITGSRGYVFGDPWQHIHWRNTARTAQPQVKEFEHTPDNSLVIVCDTGRIQEVSDEALEHAVRIAASVGNYVCRSGGAVQLRMGGINEQTTDTHRLLKELALLKSNGDRSLPALLEGVPPSSDVLAIVMDTDAEGVQTVTQLSRSQHRVVTLMLRGFDSSGVSIEPSEISSLASNTVYECWPNGIPEALAKLDRIPQKAGQLDSAFVNAADAEYSRRA